MLSCACPSCLWHHMQVCSCLQCSWALQGLRSDSRSVQGIVRVASGRCRALWRGTHNCGRKALDACSHTCRGCPFTPTSGVRAPAALPHNARVPEMEWYGIAFVTQAVGEGMVVC